MMKHIKHILKIFSCLLAFSSIGKLEAQIIRLEVNISTNQSLESLLDLQSVVDNNLTITMSNLTDRYQEFYLEAVLYSFDNSFSVVTNPDFGVRIDIVGGSQEILEYDDLKNLFNYNTLLVNDGSNANPITLEQYLIENPDGQVPEGNYQLCVRLRPLDLNAQLVNSLGDLACGSLKFEHYTAPSITAINLTSCMYGCDFQDLPPVGSNFNVSFTPSVFNQDNNFEYQIKIFESLTGDINGDFLGIQDQVDQYLYNQTVKLGFTRSNYILEPIELALMAGKFEKGKLYGVVIQAVSNNGQPLPNEGYSQIVPIFFGSLEEENEMDPVLASLPVECSTGDCNNIPLPTGIGNDVASISNNEKIRFGCFWVTVKNVTGSNSVFSGEGTVQIPKFKAKFKVKINNAKVQKYGDELVAISGSADAEDDASIPNIGPIAEARRLFNRVGSQATDLTGDFTAGATDAGGIVDAATDTNTLPGWILSTLYGSSEVIDDIRIGSNYAIGTAITIDNATNSAVSLGQQIFNVLGQVDRITQMITTENEAGLPIGYGSPDQKLRFGIFGMSFKPNRAAITVIVQTPLIPAINNSLYFGTTDIAISPSDFSFGNTTFFLGGDLEKSISGHKLLIKGTHTDGSSNTGTYLKLKDGDLDELMFNGSFVFSRELFLPKNNSSNSIAANLFVSLKDDLENIFFEATVSEPIRLASNKRVELTIPNITLDFSSTQNPSNFPNALLSGSNGARNAWNGIMVSGAKLHLPGDFRLGNNGAAPTASVDYLIVGFDASQGLSLKASGQDLISLTSGNTGTLAGFGVSVDRLNLELLNDSLSRFDMNGKIKIGMFDKVAGVTGGGIPYNIDFLDLDDEPNTNVESIAFKLQFQGNQKIEITKLHSVFTLSNTSYLSYNSGGHDGDEGKKIQFELSGILDIDSDKDGIKMPGIQFFGFFFNGRDFESDRFNVGFASPQKVVGASMAADRKAGGFPITIERFYPILGIESNNLKFGFGFDVILNLKDGPGFGLTTGIELSTQLTQDLNLVDNTFKFNFKEIYIDANVSIAHISGGLAFVNDDPVYGNGFRGCIDVQLNMKGLPFRGGLEGMFGSIGGNDPFRYFFIEGFVSNLNINIPSTPIAFDGLALGFAYNMVPRPNSVRLTEKVMGVATGCDFNVDPKFIPEDGPMNIGIAIKVKEVSSQGWAFNGAMGFNASINMEDLSPNEFTIDGLLNFLQAPTATTNANMKIQASLALTYNFESNVFFGDANVDMVIASGNSGIRGGGTMGFFVSEEDWYIYLGNPWGNPGLHPHDLNQDRYATINFDIDGANIGEAGMYFCMGTYGIRLNETIPDGFPSEIQEWLNDNRNGIDPRASSGAGVAFGSYLKFDLRVGDNDDLFYGSLSFGMGFDLALVRYISAQCGRSSFGINNYYATGQIYGFAKGILGLNYDGDPYKLASAEFIAAGTFGGPNPTWVNGTISLDKESTVAIVSTAATIASGGFWALVDAVGELAFDKSASEEIVDNIAPRGIRKNFSVGEACTIDIQDSYIDAQNAVKIIQYILPQVASGETTPKIEAKERITVIFSEPLRQEWSFNKPVTQVTGTGLPGQQYTISTSTTTYVIVRRKWELDKVSIKVNGGSEQAYDFIDISPTEYQYWLRNTDNIRPGASLSFSIKLKLMEKIGNGTWQVKTRFENGGGNAVDEKSVTFTIKEVDYKINVSDLAFSYPQIGQNYFLQSHGSKFLIFNQQFDELREIEPNNLITKTYANGELIGSSNFKYGQLSFAESKIEYETPQLPNGSDIRVKFNVKIPKLNLSTANSLSTKGSNFSLSGNARSNNNQNISSPNSNIISKNSATDIGQVEYEEIEIFAHTFKTSKYNSFSEKLSNIISTQNKHWDNETYTYSSKIELNEPWDDLELGNNRVFQSAEGGHVASLIRLKKSTENSDWLRTMKQKAQTAYSNGEYVPNPNGGLFDVNFYPTLSNNSGHISIENERNQMIYDGIGAIAENPKPSASNIEHEFEYNYPVISGRQAINYFGSTNNSSSSGNSAASNSTIYSGPTVIPAVLMPINNVLTAPINSKLTVEYLGMDTTISAQNSLAFNSLSLLNAKAEPNSKSKIQIKRN